MSKLFFAVFLGAVIQSGKCQPPPPSSNSWISSVSGNWQDAQWSLGILPGAGQTIFLTNAGWKAVTINPQTTENYPQTLAVSSVEITSPETNTSNELLMSYSGLAVPLSTDSMYVGSNCAVMMDYSSLYVTNELEVDGEFTQDVSSLVMTGSGITLGVDAPGTYTLASGQIADSSSNSSPVETVGVNFSSQFIQQDGTNQVGFVVVMPGSEYDLNGGILDGGVLVNNKGTFNQAGGAVVYMGTAGSANFAVLGTYLESGGTITSSNRLYVPQTDGPWAEFSSFNNPFGAVTQTGGTNILGSLSIGFISAPIGGAFGPSISGTYTLSNGVLETSGSVLGGNGQFTQAGGSHLIAGNLTVQGIAYLYPYVDPPVVNQFQLAGYALNGGQLVSEETAVGLAASIEQSGGTNTVQNLVLSAITEAQGVDVSWLGPSYSLTGGQLIVSDISLTNASFNAPGGNINQSGVLSLNGSTLSVRTNVQLGVLALGLASSANSVLQLETGPCVIGFANSSGLSWATNAVLSIRNWDGSLYGGGQQQLSFGNGQGGLTDQQLTEVQFLNPAGLPSGTYPARILADGEVVPDSGSPLPLNIEVVGEQSNGASSMILQGIAGQNYEIDGSTDLVHWVMLSTLSNSMGTVTFSDNSASNYPQRFYRARTPN